MIYRGNITGDLNRLDISPGYYCIGAPGTISHGLSTKNDDAWCQFIQWGDGYKTQYIIDGMGIHTRTYVGNPAKWEQWTRTNGSSGNGTINPSTTTIYSSSHLKWFKHDIIVTIELYDIELKAGFNTDNSMVIASNLPPGGFSGVIFSIPAKVVGSSESIQYRLCINEKGEIRPWYMGTSQKVQLNGAFTYIMEVNAVAKWSI